MEANSHGNFRGDPYEYVLSYNLTGVGPWLPIILYYTISSTYIKNEDLHVLHPASCGGQVLMGDKISSSPYELKMEENSYCSFVCKQNMSKVRPGVTVVHGPIDHFSTKHHVT